MMAIVFKFLLPYTYPVSSFVPYSFLGGGFYSGDWPVLGYSGASFLGLAVAG